MTVELSFTAEQRALIEAVTSTYVEACPGAGKTQAIVQRFVERRGADPRRGLALLSFTNTAVDEARSRCANQPELIRAPNYVGTIDGFINRFLVAPVFLARTGVAATFRDTWASVPGSSVNTKGVNARASLDWFEFDVAGTAKLTPARVPSERRYSLSSLEAWQIKKLEEAASRLWKSHIRRGVLDAAASRKHLAEFLRDHEMRDLLADLIEARFSEVIVDELQDCCREDVLVLELLRDSGVRLIMVGDPDQAIYGFRGATDNGLTSLLESVKRGQRLDGNFRSTPSVCRFVDSLRFSGAVDVAVGRNANLDSPVVLMGYSSLASVSTRVAEIVDRWGIPQQDVVVLAHAESKARACAGAGSVTRTTDNRLARLASAVHVIQDEAQPGIKRADALRIVQRLIRELGTEGRADLSEEEYFEAQGLTSRTTQYLCLRLAMAVPPPFENAPSAWRDELMKQTDSQRLLGWSPAKLRGPKGDDWPSIPKMSDNALPYSTIHGYKGLQAPAVVLVIPDRPKATSRGGHGLQLWESGADGEPRRVLYVGASRAERLLIVAAHDSVCDSVQGILLRDEVPFVSYAEQPDSPPR